MYKEIIISIIIIVLIVSMDFVLQKYTRESIEEVSGEISKLGVDIREEKLSHNQIEEKTKQIYEKWVEYKKKLVFYIEHDELEKVETDFITGKSFIESEKYSEAIAELEKTSFVLEHIKDKYSFNLENIF